MTDKEQIIIDEVSNFCLVCYYDKENKELVRIEQYKDGSGDMQTDIESYKYGYNAKIIKPEELIKKLAHKTQECEDLKLILQQSKDNNKSTMLLLAKKNEECEELKEDLKRYKGVLKDTVVTKIDYLQESLTNQIKADHYRKALEEIEEECNYAPMCDTEFSERVLTIINEIKEIQ